MDLSWQNNVSDFYHISYHIYLFFVTYHMPFGSTVPKELFRNPRKNKSRMQEDGFRFNMKERAFSGVMLKVRNGLPQERM